jgi:hypothetical protein
LIFMVCNIMVWLETKGVLFLWPKILFQLKEQKYSA